ncbi:MAG: Sec-independent protein translocase subunit TatA/TatB [Thermoleophilaceae bacterium]
MEIAVIAVIALIVLGPTKLPEAARSLGKGFREMRDSFSGAASDDEDELDLDEKDEEDDDDLKPGTDEDYMPEAFGHEEGTPPSEDETATLAGEDEKTVSLNTGSAPQEGLDEAHQNDARSSVPSASSSSIERE